MELQEVRDGSYGHYVMELQADLMTSNRIMVGCGSCLGVRVQVGFWGTCLGMRITSKCSGPCLGMRMWVGIGGLIRYEDHG